VSTLAERLLGVPPWAVILVVGALVFAEDALFVGFVLPGETAAVLGGVAARLGHVSLTAVLITVIAAAVVGDTVGYEIGRHVGARILQLRILDKRRLNAAGGVSWGLAVVLLGYLAGESYARVEKLVGRGAALVVLAVVLVALAVWRIRRHRAEARQA
jgi:membrane-associated protein